MHEALREVAEELVRFGTHLFGIEPDVVGERRQGVHQLRGLVTPPGERERLHKPERAADEYAFAAAQTIRSEIAVHQRATAELTTDRFGGTAQARVGGRSKPHDR